MEKKQRTQIIITAFLVLILVIAWANAIKTIRARSKSASSSRSASSSKSVPTIHVEAIDHQAAIPAPKKTKDTFETFEWKRCPFCGLLLNDEANLVELQLNGIIWDANKPQVLINNEPYLKGDQVEQYTIVEIFKHKVVLSDGEKEFELLLL